MSKPIVDTNPMFSQKNTYFLKTTRRGKYHIVEGGSIDAISIKCSKKTFKVTYDDLKEKIPYNELCSRCEVYE